MPLFSIIVPVYGVEKYIDCCIQSIAGQSFRDFELILVDDGSPDKCPEICDCYAQSDSRITVVHKPNGGIASARKAGVGQCTGSYILNVDSDDYIESGLLQRLSVILNEYSPDILAFGYTNVDEDGNAHEKVVNPQAEGFYSGAGLDEIRGRLVYDRSLRDFNNGCLIYSIWSKAIRRELFEKCESDVPDNINRGEDTAVFVPALCRGSSLYVSTETGYNYRSNDASSMHTFNPREFAKYSSLLAHLKANAPEVDSANINAYGFRLITDQITEAARSMNSFGEFAAYVKTSLDPVLNEAVDTFDTSGLIWQRRVKARALKKHRWREFWLFYHR